MSEKDNTGTRIKSDETLFKIIHKLWELGEVGVTELADHIGMTKGAVYKHLRSLEDEEFVVNRSGRYRLSLKFLTIGGDLRGRNRLCQLMEPKVEILNERTNAISIGAIEENGHGVFVYSLDEYFNKNPLGDQFGLHQNAVGKAMLAEFNNESIEEIIDQHGLEAETEHTITDRDELFQEIGQIRDQGYAIAKGERTEHVHAVGASVYDPRSETLGGMSVALPENRVSQNELESKLKSEVLTVLDELKLEIKYS